MDFETRDKIGSLIKKMESVHCLLFIMEAVMVRDIYTTKDCAPAVEGISEYLSIQVEELRRLCAEADALRTAKAADTLREAG